MGGGGIGQLWGPTSREEAVATVRQAVDSGITFLDSAPRYGDGEAELVIGTAFEGRLPSGVMVSTKCQLGNPDREQVLPILEESLTDSLARMKLDRVDIFFLHNMIIPDEALGRYQGTTQSLFNEWVRPAFQRLVSQGRVGAWGITGIGVPELVLAAVAGEPPPEAIQVIANLLDSPGGLKRYQEPARPREIAAAAKARDMALMGIRAVQAGALTGSLDRELAADHPETLDYQRAAPFREVAKEAGESPASLAHRYALTMEGIATVVLGVKNRSELQECVDAEAKGRLDPELMARIDQAVAGAR
jgi:aryl-alcohol dehydrogenase-like predicted oxidoreductase